MARKVDRAVIQTGDGYTSADFDILEGMTWDTLRRRATSKFGGGADRHTRLLFQGVPLPRHGAIQDFGITFAKAGPIEFIMSAMPVPEADDEDEDMITVAPMNDRPFRVEVPRDMRVETLRERIAAVLLLDPSEIQLIGPGKVLPAKGDFRELGVALPTVGAIQAVVGVAEAAGGRKRKPKSASRKRGSRSRSRRSSRRC